MPHKNKKKKISAIASVVLSFNCFQYSSSDYSVIKSSIDEYAGIQIVQTITNRNSTDEGLFKDTSDVSLVVSFEKEKRIINLMEEASSSDDFSESNLDEAIKSEISDISSLENLIDFIEMSKNYNWLIVFAKMYLNLISNRSPQIIARIIEICFNSKDLSINSFGIDLLSLHFSYAECSVFLKKSFSHPFLKKKMNMLINEVVR